MNKFGKSPLGLTLVSLGSLAIMAVALTTGRASGVSGRDNPATAAGPLPGDRNPPAPTADEELRRFHADQALSEIERAQTWFPYEPRLPLILPAGSALAHAMSSEDTTAAGDLVHSLDTWYSLPGGGRLHLWQTNAPLTEKNPVAEPDLVAIVAADGRVWRLAATSPDGVGSLSAKFEDGITVSVDFPVSNIDSSALLSSITPVGRGPLDAPF